VSEFLTGLLRRALESLERREDEKALQRLLEAWRVGRAERLALLVERFTALEDGPAPAESLLDLLELRETLMEKPGKLVSPRDLGTGLSDFLRWPADPRFTPVLLDLAALPVARQEALFVPLLELFLKQKDPRTPAPLRELHARLPAESPYAERLDSLLDRGAAWKAPGLGSEASALCEALEEALTRREEALARSTPLREELLAHVAAHPEDDDARRVLADHLLAHGDPLGELLILQCQPQPDEALIAGLLKQHRTRWEALLGPGVWRGEVRFERGLPVAVKMRGVPQGKLLPPPGRFWCAVREIDWSWQGGQAEADWLAHPCLRGVTVLKNVHSVFAARLGTHPLPVRLLVMGGRVARAVPRVFHELAALPHLTWLKVHLAEPQDVRLCASSPLARRLEHFEALSPEAWSLGVSPAVEVPVEATLLSEAGCEGLAVAVSAAAGFSTRALRIESRNPLGAGDRRLLEGAAAAYARVEWSLPPG
jgi:uncharacterized protein (TIGR02996 family)